MSKQSFKVFIFAAMSDIYLEKIEGDGAHYPRTHISDMGIKNWIRHIATEDNLIFNSPIGQEYLVSGSYNNGEYDIESIINRNV